LSEEQDDRYCPACGLNSDQLQCPGCTSPTLPRVALRLPSVELRAGDIIGDRYRVMEVLGQGAFGAVYGAEHVTTKQPVALKLLMPAPAGSPEEHVRRFYREAQVTANLRHANTVRVFDIGQTKDGAFFIAMERLYGKTLEELLIKLAGKGQTLTEPEAIDIGVAILGSLAEAHDKGLVHRDLKPANIMLSSVAGEPVIKVLDFGIVRSQGSGLTQDGRCVGTPAFMSPEQCMGQRLDGRSDLYALATLMYVCVTGRLVFSHDVPLTQMMMQVRDDPIDLREYVLEPITDRFADLVMRNLSKDPDARSKNARQLRRALAELRPKDGGLRTARYESVKEAVQEYEEELRRSASAPLPVAPKPRPPRPSSMFARRGEVSALTETEPTDDRAESRAWMRRGMAPPEASIDGVARVGRIESETAEPARNSPTVRENATDAPVTPTKGPLTTDKVVTTHADHDDVGATTPGFSLGANVDAAENAPTPLQSDELDQPGGQRSAEHAKTDRHRDEAAAAPARRRREGSRALMIGLGALCAAAGIGLALSGGQTEPAANPAPIGARPTVGVSSPGKSDAKAEQPQPSLGEPAAAASAPQAVDAGPKTPTVPARDEDAGATEDVSQPAARTPAVGRRKARKPRRRRRSPRRAVRRPVRRRAPPPPPPPATKPKGGLFLPE